MYHLLTSLISCLILNSYIGNFHDSTSEFKEYEEGQLSIVNTYASTIQSLFPDFDYAQEFSDVPGFLDAMLAGIGHKEIKDMDKCTTQKQRTLLCKLQEVFANNYEVGPGPSAKPRDEGAVDNFVHFLLSTVGFDAYPIEVRAKPLLDLEIGNWMFAAISDFGIRSHESVYLSVVEHRRSTTYNKSRLQLACGMIAAAQVRYQMDENLPFNIFGILVVADQFAFVSATISKAYLDCLLDKTTPPTIEFHWWPPETHSKYPTRPNALGFHMEK